MIENGPALDVDVSLKRVSLSFPRRGEQEDLAVLEGIDFEVKRGQLYCLVGPSGCGKTTLLRVVIGDLSPTEGSLFVRLERASQGFAYIPQAGSLLPWRTLFQNAALGAELRGRMAIGDLRGIQDLVNSYGLSGFEERLPHELSGGMRQRVSVIRALGSRPAIMLCDEPFSSVDFPTRLRLNTIFKEMCKLRGISTLFVTHNIEEAIFLGDKVAVLSQRPAKIAKVYEPRLTIHPEDAVKCRQSPEFELLFEQIWRDLEGV